MTDNLDALVDLDAPINIREMLSVRAGNALWNHNIRTLRDLITTPLSELRRLPNFGNRCLSEVREFLLERGFDLYEDQDKVRKRISHNLRQACGLLDSILADVLRAEGSVAGLPGRRWDLVQKARRLLEDT